MTKSQLLLPILCLLTSVQSVYALGDWQIDVQKAEVFRSKRDFATARQLYREAASAAETGGATDKELASIYSGAGWICYDQTMSEKDAKASAESDLSSVRQEGIDWYQKTFALYDRHPQQLHEPSVNELTFFANLQTDQKASLAAQRRAVAVGAKTKGKGDLFDYVMALSNLASSLTDSKPHESEKWLKKAIAVDRNGGTLGLVDARLIVLDSLSALLEKEEKWKAAEKYLRVAVEAEKIDSRSTDAAPSERFGNRLATVLEREGQNAEAQQIRASLHQSIDTPGSK